MRRQRVYQHDRSAYEDDSHAHAESSLNGKNWTRMRRVSICLLLGWTFSLFEVLVFKKFHGIFKQGQN